MARSDGHHPVLCACGASTYRYDGRCWRCAPTKAVVIRDAPKHRRPRGRKPILPHPSRLPAEYLAACAAELAKRAAERESAIARICADLRREAA